ncbi:MAG: hypothetical protein ABW003_06885 [Microvirga sp.]
MLDIASPCVSPAQRNITCLHDAPSRPEENAHRQPARYLGGPTKVNAGGVHCAIVWKATRPKSALDLPTRASTMMRCARCSAGRLWRQNAVIQPKADLARPIAFDFAMYCQRPLVENFICALKQFHRIATRYDKTDQRFEATIDHAASLMASK